MVASGWALAAEAPNRPPAMAAPTRVDLRICIVCLVSVTATLERRWRDCVPVRRTRRCPSRLGNAQTVALVHRWARLVLVLQRPRVADVGRGIAEDQAALDEIAQPVGERESHVAVNADHLELLVEAVAHQ